VPELNFRVAAAAPMEFAAVPTLGLQLLVDNTGTEIVHSVALRCQIQLEVTRRNYTPEERKNLADLFGEPGRWEQTLRAMLWTHVQTVVPSFAGSTSIDLAVPCTFDFNVAATKYFYGLEDGEIPLCLMFSSTVFVSGPDGALQVSPISWDKETRFRLPVPVWREMMDRYYPNTAWLCLERDAFDRVNKYKTENGIASWERTLDRLPLEFVEVAGVQVRPGSRVRLRPRKGGDIFDLALAGQIALVDSNSTDARV
jgi:hypothetical protein